MISKLVSLGVCMGKADTIKQRAVYVYLPSVEQKQRWETYAGKQGTSISKFVIEHVEDSLRQEEEPSFKSRDELWKEINELQEQIEDLRKRNRLLRHVVDKLEQERLRVQA
jgi:gas vesicle protein